MRAQQVSPYIAFALGGLWGGIALYVVLVLTVNSCTAPHLRLPPTVTHADTGDTQVPADSEDARRLRELASLQARVEELQHKNLATKQLLQQEANEEQQTKAAADALRTKVDVLQEQQQQTSGSRQVLMRYEPPPAAGTIVKVGVAAVADDKYAERFAVSIASQRCFAKRHGYEYNVLNPERYTMCRQRSFFFRKHCTVARFLETKPKDYFLFVMDGDSPAVVLDRNLDTWVAEARSTDVLLYERWMNNEIMAGNYGVRNSEWGIKFCDGWASYDKIDEPKGYHSADNGAIHMHLLRTLRISKHKLCAYLWDRIATYELDEYYQFVSCARLLMGPPRRWKVGGVLRVTILPRGHAFAIDGFISTDKTSSVGAVFHHGQKEEKQYLLYFTEAFVDGSDRTCSSMLRDTKVGSEQYLGFLTSSLKLHMTGSFQGMAKIAGPAWDFAYIDCIPSLSCRPLSHEGVLDFSLPPPGQRAAKFARPSSRKSKFKPCATEHEVCKCAGIVKFGVGPEPSTDKAIYTSIEADVGRIKCDIPTFGDVDPASGEAKKCFCEG